MFNKSTICTSLIKHFWAPLVTVNQTPATFRTATSILLPWTGDCVLPMPGSPGGSAFCLASSRHLYGFVQVSQKGVPHHISESSAVGVLATVSPHPVEVSPRLGWQAVQGDFAHVPAIAPLAGLRDFLPDICFTFLLCPVYRSDRWVNVLRSDCVPGSCFLSQTGFLVFLKEIICALALSISWQVWRQLDDRDGPVQGWGHHIYPASAHTLIQKVQILFLSLFPMFYGIQNFKLYRIKFNLSQAW